MQIFHFPYENALHVTVALLVSVACVNSQNDTEPTVSVLLSTTTTTTTTTTEAAIPVVKCGNTQNMVDECFKDLPPHLMEFLQTTKIAINERDIVAKCTVFNRGMRCFDDYTTRCMGNKKLNLFKNNVEGARKFFLRFCSDREFQKDYLQHKDCFTYIQDDWVLCTKNFQNIVTEELHGQRTNITNKFMEFCCARYAYENCIYNSARYKCYKNSAKFARETAKMLSDEKHFSNCRQYENTLCSVGHAHRLVRLLLLLSLLPAVRMIEFGWRRWQP